MTIIEDLGDFLASKGLGTLAVDIILNRLTNTADNQIGIFSVGGYPQPLQIKDAYPSFTIQVRNSDSRAGLLIINNIFNLFDNELTRSIITPSGRKIIFRKIQPPFFLKYDTENLAYYSMGFDVLTSRD